MAPVDSGQTGQGPRALGSGPAADQGGLPPKLRHRPHGLSLERGITALQKHATAGRDFGLQPAQTFRQMQIGQGPRGGQTRILPPLRPGEEERARRQLRAQRLNPDIEPRLRIGQRGNESPVQIGRPLIRREAECPPRQGLLPATQDQRFARQPGRI